jgi:folate-binding protein YgfZ
VTTPKEQEWLERSVGVRALRDRAVLEVRGDDAREWLQGQVTNQTEDARPGDTVYGFILTLKGRVLADVWMLFDEDRVWLEVPSAQVQAVQERLDRYIIMEDVDLAHRSDLALLAAEGPKATDVRPGGWPSARLGRSGRVWLVPNPQLETELAHATARAAELGGGAFGEDAWAALHVVRGRPRFGVDFGEFTYPQESGLAPVAVSFRKGCYIGQETVVMLENRGKAPKTLWRWTLSGGVPSSLPATVDRAGQPVGQITSAVSTGGTTLALGFLKRGEDENLDGLAVGGASARAEQRISDDVASER